MIKHKIITIMILVMFQAIALSGQNLKQDILKINENYSPQKSFKIRMAVTLYEKEKIVETSSYTYFQEDNKSCNSIANISSIAIDDIILTIDDKMKFMFVSKSEHKKPNTLKAYDTLIDLASSHEFNILDSSGGYQYVLHFKKQSLNKLEINFNPITYTINKLRITYPIDKKSEKVIEFVYGDPLPISQEDKNKLDIKYYLLQNKSSITPSQLYKDYELIDNRTF